VDVSLDLRVDLVGISVNQKPPVVKAQDFSKLSYKIQKSKAAASSKGKAKPAKEYKFKAAIAEHDLQRKVSNVIKYLGKGHTCKIIVMANGFTRRKNQNALVETVDKVKEMVGENGSLGSALKMNEDQSYATMILLPKNS